jgi:hypothetical protein
MVSAYVNPPALLLRGIMLLPDVNAARLKTDHAILNAIWSASDNSAQLVPLVDAPEPYMNEKGLIYLLPSAQCS